jgi:carboxyl-terminal processing protease
MGFTQIKTGKRTRLPSSPQSYLLKALSIIEKNSLKAKDIDWQKVKSDSLEMAKDAQTIAHTYSAIVYALRQLNDNHSFLIPAKGQRISDYEATGPRQRIPRKAKSKLISGSTGDKIGVLVVREISAGRSALLRYAKARRDDIDSFRQAGAKGWIVDLRNNLGGSMWPMLLGLGPILGSGKLGSFESHQISVPWFYENGEVGVILKGGIRRVKLKIADATADLECFEPIGVLIDEQTASSGEAVAIAFKGRPNTAFFGKRTRGLSTCNDTIRLSDGARMFLTIAVDADRDSHLYEFGVDPDFFTDADKESKSSDPTLEAATHWVVNKLLLHQSPKDAINLSMEKRNLF